MPTAIHLTGVDQRGIHQSDSSRPTMIQKIKNYFSGGRPDRARAIFMRSIGRPLHLTPSEVKWRISHGRLLTGYTTNYWNLNEFFRADSALQNDFENDIYRLNLSNCKLKNVSLANAEVGSGSVKNSNIQGLNVSHSKLGGLWKEGGFDVSGAKGDIKLAFSDLSGWRFNKQTEISNKAEVNEACAKFLNNDITLILGIITSINSISNHRDNIPHQIKLMNYLASAFDGHYKKIADATPEQLGAQIFLEKILSSNSIYHESKKNIDCKRTLNDKNFDAIFALYEYGKQQENKQLKRHICELACSSCFCKFLEGSPQYFRLLVSDIKSVQEMTDLANYLDCKNFHKLDVQKFNFEQKDVLHFLKLSCRLFKEKAEVEGDSYAMERLKYVENSIQLDIQHVFFKFNSFIPPKIIDHIQKNEGKVIEKYLNNLVEIGKNLDNSDNNIKYVYFSHAANSLILDEIRHHVCEDETIDLNEQYGNGDTLLHLLAKDKNEVAIKYLLRAPRRSRLPGNAGGPNFVSNFDLTIKNNDGKTAIDIARENSDHNLENYLQAVKDENQNYLSFYSKKYLDLKLALPSYDVRKKVEPVDDFK